MFRAIDTDKVKAAAEGKPKGAAKLPGLPPMEPEAPPPDKTPETTPARRLRLRLRKTEKPARGTRPGGSQDRAQTVNAPAGEPPAEDRADTEPVRTPDEAIAALMAMQEVPETGEARTRARHPRADAPSTESPPRPTGKAARFQPWPRPAPRWTAFVPEPIRSVLTLPREIPEVDTFALVVLSPLPFLLLGALFGGVAAAIGLVWITLFIFFFDVILRRAAPDAPEGSEFPAADLLSQVLAGAHFVLLFTGIWALSGGTGLGLGSWVMVFLGLGLFFGQVSNSNAHEMIHRSDRKMFLLGKWVYTSLLFGHHTSAHRHVHHRFVATPGDPNSAELGEGFWAFAPRAWIGSFVSGYEMERNLRQKHIQAAAEAEAPLERARLWLRAQRPYADYLLGGVGFVLLVWALFGFGGLVGYLLLCAYAQLQLLLSDYVQHYGLRRRQTDIDKFEPVGPQHSWDAPHPVSALWMLNAPRHSDHHAHPGRPYPALQLGDLSVADRPVLPQSLPAMAVLALIPPIWRRVMDKRVAAMIAARQTPVPATSRS